MLEDVGEMVEAGNVDVIGEDNGGKEVEVSMMVVSMVEDIMNEVGIE